MRSSQVFEVLTLGSRGVLACFAIAVVSCTGTIGVERDVGAGGDQGSGGAFANGSGGQGGVPVGFPGQGGNAFSGEPPSFRCDASDQKVAPDSIGLRKLTTAQYRNTLRDVIRFATGSDTDTSSILTAADAVIRRYPADSPLVLQKRPMYRQMNQDLQDTQVQGAYDVALAVASQVTSSSSMLTKFVGACATDSSTTNDRQCVDDFINRFGERALRRPMNADDLAFYRTMYGTQMTSDPAAWADLIGVFLCEPHFLYMVEHGASAVVDRQNVFALSSYELASRLSYQFLQSMPDEELWQSAMSGMLTSTAEYERQVDRLIGIAATRQSTKEFWEDFLGKAFTELGDVAKNVADSQYKMFAAKNLPSPNLSQSMRTEAIDYLQYFTWDKAQGSVNDILHSRLSFARTTDLADIYGVPVWNGKGEPPAFPSEQDREGLFTHAAFTATETVRSRPIMKGRVLRTYVMCEEIPSPPANAAANAVFDTVKTTSREQVAGLTEQPGTACAGCHKQFMNGLGFATEHFDSLSRFQNTQQVWNANKQPEGTKPVDSSAVPHVFVDDERPVTNAFELMERVSQSAKVEACIARNIFRFTFARLEAVDSVAEGAIAGSDSCVLSRVLTSIKAADGSLKGMFKTIAMSREFKERTIAQ